MLQFPRFVADSLLEGDGFELLVPHTLTTDSAAVVTPPDLPVGGDSNGLQRSIGFVLPKVLRDKQDENSYPDCRATAKGTNAEFGTEAISLPWKESGGLPITVRCTRSKRVAFLHISWAEQCEPDIILYRSPRKCFPLEKTGCNPS
jgi:hypothetical protein